MSTRNLPEELNGLFFGEAGGIQERFVNIFGFKVGIGVTDGLLRFASCQQPKETGNGKP